MPLLSHRFPVALVRNHHRLRRPQRQPCNPIAQACPSLGEEIGNAQIVIGPGSAQTMSPQEVGQRIDGRMHSVGGGLVLNVNPFGADRAGAGRNIGQDPPAPDAVLWQDPNRIRLCRRRDLLVGQDSDLGTLLL